MVRWARLAGLLLVSCGLPACAPSLQSPNWQTRCEAVDRLGAEDQALLAKIAMEDESETVRGAAVHKLTDQEVLAKVALGEKSLSVYAEAVNRLTDQELLAKVLAGNRFGGSVSWEYVQRLILSAFEKLTDEAALAMLALDEDFDYRTLAVKKLTDQTILAKIALDDKSGTVRLAALAQLADQGVLAKVALGDGDSGVRRTAVEKLTDQTILTKIALGESDKDARAAAVKGLTDQAVLAKVALGDTAHEVRSKAVGRLEDQTVLAKVAAEDSKPEVRELAAGRLTADGKQRLGQLRFEKIRNSEDPRELQTFLSQNPVGPYTSQARSQLRKVMYPRAVADGSCAAYAEFLAEFPQDPAAGELRRKLAAKGQWDKAKRLGELAIAMIPESGIDGKGRVVNTNPTPLKPTLEQFRVLLAAGADPAAVRIKGFESTVTVQDGRYTSTHVGQSFWSLSPDGTFQMDGFQEAPRPSRAEHPVPAAEGGLTLAEYAKANEGAWALARAYENVDPEYQSLAQDAMRLLEQTDAQAKGR